MRLRFERCFSRRSLIKRTCSLRDKLIVLLTVNRQAKIFLRRKKLPALLRRIASKDNADSYYLNCFHFFTTIKTNLNRIKKCENKEFCIVIMS